MQRMAAQRGVVLLELEFLSFQFLVASGGIAGRGFAFLPGFGALDGYDFPRHKLFLFFGFLFGLFLFALDLVNANGINCAQSA